MSAHADLDTTRFADPPPPGAAIEVAPGVLWLRLALPFRLNHVNVYLVEDDKGWMLVDTGVGDAATQSLWSTLLEGGPEGVLRDRPITRVLVTHHHPDHVGAASFLCARTGAPLLMGDTEYLTTRLLLAGDAAAAADPAQLRFYGWHGLKPDEITGVAGHAARYRRLVPALPKAFVSLRAGETLDVGARRFTVLDLPGHSAAQIGLHDPAGNLLIAADHVLTGISPNISAVERNPDDDPLGRYLTSLARLRETVVEGGLVLPGHRLPFTALHARTRELETHHHDRLRAVEEACTVDRGLTVAELVPVLFPFPLDPHQFWFAFSEVLAHANHLARLGRIEARDSHGRRRWGRIGRASHAG